MRMTIEIKKSDNLTVEGIGHLIGFVDYFTGFYGHYEDPPEPAEITGFRLTLVDGSDIPDECRPLMEEHGGVFDLALEEKVSNIYSQIEAALAEYEANRLGDERAPF